MLADIWHILVTYQAGFLSGLWVTMQLCAIIWSSGIVLGALLGILGAKWPRLMGWPQQAATFVLMSLPILVLLYLLHYPLQAMLEIVIDPFYTAAFALSVVNVFVMADLVRRVIRDFPQQYLDAARIVGAAESKIFFRIQLPIVLRHLLPNVMMQQIVMLHATLFASLISVEEIFRVAQRINSSIYKPVEIYTALGIFFILVCLPVNLFAAYLQHRFTRAASER